MNIDICRKCQYYNVLVAGNHHELGIHSKEKEYCIERYRELPWEWTGSNKVKVSNLVRRRFKMPVNCPYELEHVVGLENES